MHLLIAALSLSSLTAKEAHRLYRNPASVMPRTTALQSSLWRRSLHRIHLNSAFTALGAAQRRASVAIPTSQFSKNSDAYAAPSAAALSSPHAPLSYVFRPVASREEQPSGSSSVPGSVSPVILHTVYAPSNGTDAAPSFEVIDVEAFEALLREALQVTPEKVPTAATVSTRSSRSQRSAAVAAAPAPITTFLTNHTIRELQTLLAETEKALAGPLARKRTIDRYAYDAYLPVLKYGTFTLLTAQFVVYFNWIFFVFDWNLVEPTTYFLGYTWVFCSLVYHYCRCGEDSFSWRNLFQYMADKEAMKMYATKKLDVEAVAALEKRILEIKAELARVTVSSEET